LDEDFFPRRGQNKSLDFFLLSLAKALLLKNNIDYPVAPLTLSIVWPSPKWPETFWSSCCCCLFVSSIVVCLRHHEAAERRPEWTRQMTIISIFVWAWQCQAGALFKRDGDVTFIWEKKEISTEIVRCSLMNENLFFCCFWCGDRN
jgi:hypothetical protein